MNINKQEILKLMRENNIGIEELFIDYYQNIINNKEPVFDKIDENLFKQFDKAKDKERTEWCSISIKEEDDEIYLHYPYKDIYNLKLHKSSVDRLFYQIDQLQHSEDKFNKDLQYELKISENNFYDDCDLENFYRRQLLRHIQKYYHSNDNMEQGRELGIINNYIGYLIDEYKKKQDTIFFTAG